MLTEIPNFPDYFADVEGNIYSSKKGSRVKKMTPQYQKQWGYYSLRLIASCGNKKHMTIHRLIAIYQELLAGESNLILAEKYNTSIGIISDIKRKSSWKHITESLPDREIKFKAVAVKADIAKFICEKLQEGMMPTPILKGCIEKFGKDTVKIDTIYDIKRRRAFKSISSKYEW